jgi:hypothetical protein
MVPTTKKIPNPMSKPPGSGPQSSPILLRITKLTSAASSTAAKSYEKTNGQQFGLTQFPNLEMSNLFLKLDDNVVVVPDSHRLIALRYNLRIEVRGDCHVVAHGDHHVSELDLSNRVVITTVYVVHFLL